jgi:hypothetical protein
MKGRRKKNKEKEGGLRDNSYTMGYFSEIINKCYKKVRQKQLQDHRIQVDSHRGGSDLVLSWRVQINLYLVHHNSLIPRLLIRLKMIYPRIRF